MRKISLILVLMLLVSSTTAFATDGMAIPVLISQPIMESPVEGIPFDVTYDGNQFSISLDENASTGYTWNYMINDINHVSFIGDDYVVEGEAMPGKGGKKIATFKVNDNGVSTILFTLKRSWEEEIEAELDILVYKTDDVLIVEKNDVVYAQDISSVPEVEKEVVISYNGTAIETEKKLEVVNDINMLPLRDVVEAMGYEVIWHAEKRSVEILKGAQWTEIFIDQNSYFKNRMAPAPLSAAPVIMNSTTYVPVEFFVEILGRGIEIDSGDINFIDSEVAIHQGFVKDMAYDETGGLRITLTSEPESDDVIYQTIIHASNAFTYFNKSVEIGETIKVISPPIMAMSMPGQTSAYVIY